MNAEIRRVAFVALTLIGALVVGTTYWQAWAAGDLAARNPRRQSTMKTSRKPAMPMSPSSWASAAKMKSESRYGM